MLFLTANATATIHQDLNEKNIQLMQTEKLLTEHREMHAELIETEVNSRQYISFPFESLSISLSKSIK